ncbi:MAG: NAD(P)H-dependent oxidoreductase [Flavisolibacter sp.]|nr:NAD(P)H-dependent oxidoreductase [Flavisolibacter sp.]
MHPPLHFAGISGSLRKGSFNTAVLHKAVELVPEGVIMDIVPIAEIPIYNADLDLPIATQRPIAVTHFRNALAKADGIVIVSPEYNYSIPGGLKNAIDWASRGEDSPLLHKAVAVMGATPGLWGTVRMQLAFQAAFQFLNMHPVHKPEVLIADARHKVDAHGNLTDEKAIELIKEKLKALRKLVLKLHND